MGDVIRFDDFTQTWKKLFIEEGERTSLYVHRDAVTHEVVIVQVNDEGESISTSMSQSTAEELACSILRL